VTEQHIVYHECLVNFATGRGNENVDLRKVLAFERPINIAAVDAPPLGDFAPDHDVYRASCKVHRGRYIERFAFAVERGNGLFPKYECPLRRFIPIRGNLFEIHPQITGKKEG
jgi:hypothetical protein